MATVDYKNMSDEEILAIIGKSGKDVGGKKNKPLYERLGIDEMVRSGINPYVAAAAETIQEAAPAGYQFLNQIVGGLATPALRGYGIEPPQARTGAGKALEALGAGSGFAVGAPVRLGGASVKGISQLAKVAKGVPIIGKTAGAISGVGLLPSAARGATQFGIAGLAQTPEGGVGDVSERFMQGAGGVVGGAMLGAASRGLENIKKLGTKVAPELAENVRTQYGIFKKQLTKDFGKGLLDIEKANEGNRVDLTKPIRNFVKQIDSSKKVKNFINRLSDSSRKFFDSSKKNQYLRNLTPTESQELYNDIKSTATSKQITGDVLPNERHITRLLREIQATRERTFKGLRQLNSTYRDAMKADDLIKGYMESGKTLSASKISDQEVKAAMQYVFPKETLKELAGYGAATTVAKFIPSIISSMARIGAIGGGLGVGLARLRRGGE